MFSFVFVQFYSQAINGIVCCLIVAVVIVATLFWLQPRDHGNEHSVVAMAMRSVSAVKLPQEQVL